MNHLESKYKAEIDKILGKYPESSKRSAVMPLLFLAQRQEGYISAQSVREIAEIAGVSSTEVASVVGFYSLFHAEEGGKYRIQVCTDLPCALRGADDFLKKLCDYLGVEVGGTTEDNLFTVEEVKCLAACHKAPMFQVQGDGKIAYHENQTIEDARAFIDAVRQQHKSHSSLEKESNQ